MMNTLAFPGMGTIMAKRRSGYFQAALTLLGFAVFMGFMVWFFGRFITAAGDMSADLDEFKRYVLSKIWIAGAGLGLCAIAWFWALFSSVAIVRESRAPGPPPLP